ncbi:MAG TPA: penicillin-binding transpeptidase domain-containing protein, partial [Propionibacteriaceae bacterium]|nr:penicillin-binding transpeptidase domain-containing protein [Propionibacteriaceae bacterium]
QYVKLVQVEAAMAANDPVAAAAATEQTLTRKIRELRYAEAMESKYSKDEILERYLNIAYYGDGAYGVEAAAQHYFQVSASKLNLAQAAMLAGLVQNPTATDPTRYPASAIKRRNVVIERMVTLGIVSRADADRAKATPFDPSKVKTSPNGCVSSKYPLLCDYVVKTVTSSKMPSMGKTAEQRLNLLKRGGLTIKTLIDQKTQDAAEDAVLDMVKPTDQAIATAVMIQPKTGLIVAMAQSRPRMGTKQGETYYNYAVDSSMGGAEGYQGGSTFKAFTLAAALDSGRFTPSKTYDAPSKREFKGEEFESCEGKFTLNEKYAPANAVKSGRFDMYEGAMWSVNSYFLQLERDTGICQTVEMAEKLGVKMATGEDMIVDKQYDYAPSFTLGVAEVTPLSLTEAYATLANRGKHCDPIILKSAVTKAGKELAVPSANCKQVLRPEVADTVSRILERVVSEGTGRRATIPGGYPQAGKTGTTESNAAMWFAGYTPQMAGTAMIAVDKMDPYWKNRQQSLKNKTLRSGTWLEGSGSGDAGKIYKAAMAQALAGRPKTDFTAPTQTMLKGKRMAVPDVSGMSYEEARRVIEAAGFSTQRVRLYSSYPAGVFLGASPKGFAYLSDTIYLNVSAGAKPVPRPTTKPSSSSSPTTSASTDPTSTTTTRAPTKPRKTP